MTVPQEVRLARHAGDLDEDGHDPFEVLNALFLEGDMPYLADDGNVALLSAGASASASSVHSGHSTDDLIDGDDATTFLFDNGDHGEWYRVDLGQVRLIRAWHPVLAADAYVVSWALQWSDDDVYWTVIDTIPDTGGDYGVREIGPESHRYWRMQSTDVSGDNGKIYALSLLVMGTVDATPSEPFGRSLLDTVDAAAALALLGAVTGDFLTKNEGGQDFISAHGSMGSTETIDPTDGNVHTGTLTADCTITLNAPVGSGAATLELDLTQGASAPWLVTWPGSVIWVGGTAPTLSTTVGGMDIIIVKTNDGGANWYGVMVGGGGGGSALTVKDEGTPLATAATSLDFVGAGVVASGTGAGKTITVAGQTFATPSIVLGTAGSAGAASTGIRSDSTIAAFDATVPVTQAYSDSAATGSAAFAARRDHKHGMPAATGTTAGDANIWRPVMDGGGAVVTDGSGQAVMAYGPA